MQQANKRKIYIQSKSYAYLNYVDVFDNRYTIYILSIEKKKFYSIL